jgi:hypothetical protein
MFFISVSFAVMLDSSKYRLLIPGLCKAPNWTVMLLRFGGEEPVQGVGLCGQMIGFFPSLIVRSLFISCSSIKLESSASQIDVSYVQAF